MLSVLVKCSVQKLHHSLQIQELVFPGKELAEFGPRAMHGHLNWVVVTILSLWI